MLRFKENVSLKPYNTFGIEAETKYFYKVSNTIELKKILETNKNIPLRILGGGSNVLFTEDFDGLTLLIANKGKAVLEETSKTVIVEVQAGENWHEFVMWCLNNNYGGIENLALIPGRVGATPIQNIGAYGQEISNLIHEVHCFDYISGNFTKYTNKECKFSYRDSFLKNNNMIIYKVIFKSDNPKLLNLEYQSVKNHINDNDVNVSKLDLNEVSNVICTIRNKNLPDPTIIPNAGSFFKNAIVIKDEIKTDIFGLKDLIIWDIDDKYSKVGSARLIELIKDKLEPNKNVGLHKSHSLVLVTNSKASQDDVLNYAYQVKDVVFETFNIMLEIEPKIIIN